MLLAISPRNRAQLKNIVERWTLDSILASLQILSGMPGPDAGQHSRAVAARNRPGSRRPPRRAHLALHPGGTAAGARVRGAAAPARDRQRQGAAEPARDSGRRGPGADPGRSAAQPADRHGDVQPRRARRQARAAASSSRVPTPTPVHDHGRRPPRPASGRLVPCRRHRPQQSPRANGDRPSADAGGRAGDRRHDAGAAPATTASSAGSRSGDAATCRQPRRRPPPRSCPRPLLARHDASPPLDLDAVRKLWPDLVKKVGTALGWKLAQVEPIELEGPDVLVIAARPGYNSTFDECGTPEAQAKIGQALQRLIHRPVKIKYIRRAAGNQAQADSRPNEAERANSLSRDPMVQRVLELFEARPVQMDYGESDLSHGMTERKPCSINWECSRN